MKHQKIQLFLLALLFIPQLFAMNYLKKKASSLSRQSYDVVAPAFSDPRVEKLLNARSLNIEEQKLLATMCLEFPRSCIGRNVFSKVSPNLFMTDKEIFAERLFKQSIALDELDSPSLLVKDSADLMRELIVVSHLSPHLKIDPKAEDLALMILRSKDAFLIDHLLDLSQFNPNAQYGENNKHLATLLISSMDYDVLLLLIKHPKFNNKIIDKFGFRVGYYLLAHLKSPKVGEFFKAFMGSTLLNWDMRGLGLYKPKHFNRLFLKILSNDDDHLLVLHKILEQLIPLYEDIPRGPDKKIGRALSAAFVGDGPYGYNIFLNTDFTQKAFKALMNFNAIKLIRYEFDLKENDFWLTNGKKALKDFNEDELKLATEKHGFNGCQNECYKCQKSSQSLFRSSIWCDHAYCLSCWMNNLMGQHPETQLICSAPGCEALVPPTLFLALSSDIDDTKEVLILLLLNQTLAEGFKVQEKLSESMFKEIKGLVSCPSCDKKIVLDTKKNKARRVLCSCDKEYIVTGDANPALLPLACFINLGRCSKCKNPVDKDAAANTIKCPFCKIDTQWEPLDIK